MSIRTSKADKNYLSISANTYQWFAGTDKVYSVDKLPDTLIFGTENTDTDWDSFLKICDKTENLNLAKAVIAQGNENAVDFNNEVKNVSLSGQICYVGGTGDNVITVKGGCQQIAIGGEINSNGKNADYVQDAWSDQSSNLCSGIDLSNLSRADGKPVTIILGRFGSKIEKYPRVLKVLRIKSLGYSLYWIGKNLYVKLLKKPKNS